MRKGRDSDGEKGTAGNADASAGRAEGEEGRRAGGPASGMLDGVVDMLYTGRELMDQLLRFTDKRPSPRADADKQDTR